jgi:cytochrome c-type biogenesis protein CcmH/NrfG
LKLAPHAIVLLVAMLLSVRTVYRNADYMKPVVLWRKVLEIAPHNDRAADNIEREIERDW